MSSPARRARVKAFAKLNLTLEVLGRRADGYHDLRTIFQTISLADTIEIAFTPGRKTGVALDSNVEIPNNLIVRAGHLILEETNAKGLAEFKLKKRIPMGGGLGGGSTDAAAVLLTLPALTGRPVSWGQLVELGASLGSDVPFFLMGGTALGVGRGTELYPIPDVKPAKGIVVAPGVHVSTPEAYKTLARPLTCDSPSHKMNTSQRVALAIGEERAGGHWSEFCSNDFEPVVFRQYPKLRAIKRKLDQLGARPALMTGSGSAVFGVFSRSEDVQIAMASFRNQQVFPITFLSRARYFASWRKQLSEHIQGNQWPPHSRYSR
jgi:4-diphosphocytidyl-2-C-methyl-D-erythritol kinase